MGKRVVMGQDKKLERDFPGGPMVNNLCFYGRGWGFNP